ncbi:MAG: hypothetical protein KKH40_04265 [Nanoarchaeota archaeon]|nr:hypothetical protein [Nanoarchaeota archaeon]
METLTEKKRKWLIRQFRSGRSATSIARIQKVSRQQVYRLANRFKKEGTTAYKVKKPGRHPEQISPNFAKKVVYLRNTTDYGSVKLHVVLKRAGFGVSQRQIQKVLDVNKLTDSCPKRRGKRNYVSYQWPISNYLWHTDWSFYKGKWYCVFIDDRSRKIMASGEFNNANKKNTIFLLHQAILINEVTHTLS